MHIVFIEYDYDEPLPQQYRFSDITWPLATALVEIGCQVTILAPAKIEFTHPGIRFVPVENAIHERQNILTMVARASALARAAKRISADIYHVHQSVMAAMMTIVGAYTQLKSESIGLAVVGDGKLRVELETQSAELSISFCGNVPHDDVLRAMISADLLMLTSYAEMLPRTILEAWSVGTAVMTTNVGAIGDYLRDGENGYLLANREPAYLAQRIREAMNANSREAIAQSGYATAKTMDWDATATDYSRIYTRTVESRK